MRLLTVFLFGTCLALAAEPVPCTFSCSFDGTTTPEQATGSAMSMPQRETFVAGRSGQALQVTGEADAVYYLAAGNLPKDRGAMDLWIQPQWEPGDQERRGFVCETGRAKVGVNTIWLWKIGSGLRFDVRDPEDSYITAGISDWQRGEWHHIVANWDCEKGISLYVDGKVIGERECTWIPRTGLRFAVGKRQRNSEAAMATFEDLHIYARPLTAAEVTAAYEGKLARVPAKAATAPARTAGKEKPKLLFQLPFDDSCDATVAGGDPKPSAQSDISFQPGVFGQAAEFGTKSKLTFLRPGNLDKEAGTISFWYKPSWRPGNKGKEVWRCCFQEGPWPETARRGTNMTWLWFWGDRLRFDVSDTRDSYSRYGLSGWDPTRWHHLAVTWDHRVGKSMYIDGEPVGVASDGGSALIPMTWSVFDNFPVFHVGCGERGLSIDGLLDDFRIYAGALSPAEVRAQYANVYRLSVGFAQPGPPYLRVGEKVNLHMRLAMNGTEPYRGRVRWQVLGPDEKAIGGNALDLDLTAKNPEETCIVPVTLVAPGKHVIRVTYDVPGGTASNDLALYAVPPEPTAKRPAELQTELLERIDLTKDLPPERFAQEGESRIVTAPIGTYREAGMAHRSRFAVHAVLPEADAAYVLEVDYPDDKARTMEILAQPAQQGSSAYELQTGVYCGDEYPLSKRMLTHRCVFWARTKEMAFLFMTAEEGRPAAVSEMRLYRLAGRLPNHLGPVSASPHRHVGIYYEDPALCYDFGGHDTMPEFSRTIGRLMDYMEWSGQDLFMYPGVWYHGPLYPSRSQQLAMSRTHPANFIGYILTRFEARGLSFIPTLNVHDLSSLAKYKCTEELLASGKLGSSPLMVYKDGMPNLGGWHGTPPNYNPLHPEVRKAILAMAEEMAELYGDSPAFRGICFHLPRHVMLWFGHADAGYNDYCLDAFQQETGTKIPVAADDPSRARKSWLWLKDNAWDAWISWRCRAMRGLYLDVAAKLTAKRPDLKLIINSYRPSIRDWMEDKDYMQPGYVLRVNREAGLDPTLYANDPSIVIDQTIYPADYRWSRAHGRKSNVERQRQRHFQAQSFALLQGLSTGWVNMHDRYWEDAIGRTKPIQADWLKETGWRVSTLNPTPPQFLQHYLAPLRFGDVQTITKGGFLIGTHGVEDELAQFSRAFRALPSVHFDDVAKQGDVRVRSALDKGSLYVYVANTGNAPATKTLRIDGTPSRIADLGKGAAIPAGKSLQLDLAPYSLRSFRIDGRGLSVRVE
jgi:hypothetical protein